MASLRVPVADQTGELVKNRLVNFFNTFELDECVDESDDSLLQHKLAYGDYRMQIGLLEANQKTTVYVNFKHVLQHDLELAEAIELEYYRFEPYFRHAVQEMVSINQHHYVLDVDKGQREFFVAFYNMPRTERIRSMRTEKIGRLIAISGTVTRSTEVRPELLFGSFVCNMCGALNKSVEQQFQYTEPQTCISCKHGKDFQLMLNDCSYVDWQRLRVQENADEIPAGSMPRCIDIICRNEIVETAKAGDKVIFTGSVIVIPEQSGSGRVGDSVVSGKITGRGDQNLVGGVSGLKSLGVKEMTYRMLFIACAVQFSDHRTGGPGGVPIQPDTGTIGADGAAEQETAANFTDAEMQQILAMRQTPQLYLRMVESICPTIFGHLEVKRGILLMLFGGVHKVTNEGISLRGDINVCIVGDPSVAKSQFLKYVHSFLPRTVYTSGKSSSAAGLTASVVRDNETGEYCVEAGALMLADNGICCIDEFDKMDPHDQVAIHEAMEQQTISITKAGIQATLNARTSILAAANPIFGRYDRSKTLKANVAISAPIMSRFDLFFVILDECNPAIDDHIARHIIDVHREGGRKKVLQQVPFNTDQLHLYLRFGRTLNPVITPESRRVMVECYRSLRQNDILGKNKTAYRITVRQLESLIRLSEALARLHLDELVQPVYVREAYRLLQKSIIFVETEDIELEDNEDEMDRLENTSHRFRRGDDDMDDHPDRYMAETDEPEQSHFDHNDASGEGSDEGHLQQRNNRKRRVAETYVDETVAREEQAADVSSSAAVNADAESSARPAKSATQMSAKDYEDTTHMIALFLKAQEEKEPDAKGCTWGFVLEWYLSQFQDQLTSLDAFMQKKKVTNQVIRRMIKHDGIIIVVGDTAETGGEGEGELGEKAQRTGNETKLLRLHPSYEP